MTCSRSRESPRARRDADHQPGAGEGVERAGAAGQRGKSGSIDAIDAAIQTTSTSIAASRHLRNPWWGVSGGSDREDGEELRAVVRQRLERGDLITTPKRVWGGRAGPALVV